MKILFIISAFLIPVCGKAQDTLRCICTYQYTLKYPKLAEENKISGVVLIELDIDSFYIYSNPVVKKSLGYGCDEEALRIVRLFIEKQNACRRKCYTKTVCTPGKVTQTISFILSQD